MKKKIILSVAALILAAASGLAQAQKPADLKFSPLRYDPPDPKTFRVELANGLRGYFQEDHSLPVFTMSALIGYGGLYVPAGKTGLEAILAETLIKGGTAKREGSAIEDRVDFLGGSLDFSTGERTSTLTMTFLSRDLDEGLAIFFDVLMNAEFREAAVSLAKARLVEQLRQANDQPSSVLSREYERLLYGDHPLTRQPDKKSYESVTPADLKAVRSANFLPGNVILAASGDFDRARLKAAVNRLAGGWKGKSLRPLVLSREFPKPEPGVYFIQMPINQGYINLGHLGIEEGNPDYFAVQVMNFILGGGSFSSRITAKVRSDEGLSYNQGSRFATRWGFPGTFAGYVQTKSSTVGYAIALIQAEFDRIRRQPVADTELETAVNYFLESFSNFFESPQVTMATFANLEMTGKPLDYYRTYRQKIQAVSKARVREVAEKYIRPEDVVIMIVGDFDPCNRGGEKWAGPLEKLGVVRAVKLKDPLSGAELK